MYCSALSWAQIVQKSFLLWKEADLELIISRAKHCPMWICLTQPHLKYVCYRKKTSAFKYKYITIIRSSLQYRDKAKGKTICLHNKARKIKTEISFLQQLEQNVYLVQGTQEIWNLYNYEH